MSSNLTPSAISCVLGAPGWLATKTSPKVQAGEEVDEDALLQGVLILRAGEKEAQPLNGMRQSLMHVLGNDRWTGLRVYVLLDDKDRKRVDAIRTEVLRTTRAVGW